MDSTPDLAFTAGVTLHDDRTLTVDVTAIDGEGLTYQSEEGEQRLRWADVKAVMLATTDHMLESAGYLFSMAERVQEQEQSQPYEAAEMRRFALGLLQQAAPRLCPQGPTCGLQPSPPPPQPDGPYGDGET